MVNKKTPDMGVFLFLKKTGELARLSEDIWYNRTYVRAHQKKSQ